ncbi:MULTISPECIES: UDP-N-acetylglucosamine 1-carboxyvinyltransferase [Leptospira]|uniref:UDP-N-acetylglucosamine 1-carboxyvinyltransferase n=1 Tax=Leptospira kirschneri serovar Pomona TaxID=561005 RepID=A0A1T1DGG4_9LEPT|nr:MULTISPECIES: UDP-N-acetylglucosamine 1-carboxyvinyltransferase [Leptospira]EMK03782.1 UDP-N-acetylglucosamine 1-carboxyvinyltransferase [Leptospira kirschneri]KXZ23707.1 UDP-N-acetylglucosamine 1-carboxyvinyltransferase [Leptospira kirschneri]KXZ26485.1 UDP-N-acetylglucosamine 1-carboxyvinyltransferase [Leptospira sp. ZV016]OOV39810.1 UDP-N-acetylglucosamine 1-carboxyvinyltransferase [Leptospira kirschneri serovar Pomona]
MRSSYFKIIGKTPLHGTVVPQGNKNEALPLLGAVCMVPGTVRISNIPVISDVLMLMEVLRHLGMEINEEEPGTYLFKHHGNLKNQLPEELCSRIRGAVTLAGPILAMTGRVFLPKPGGDKIGRRRLDTHLLALQALGASIEVFPDGYEIKADQLKGTDILMDEASVTGTENAVMAAVFAEGTTILRHAASEPHVQRLCHFLNSAGAKISGIGSNILTIEGVTSLKPPSKEHKIGSDYLEVGSFISLAAVTGGELMIRDVEQEDIRMIRMVYSRLGIEVRPHENGILVPSDQKMEIIPDYHGATPKIDDSPWPGFPADMTSVALVTATQCKGTILIHEKMFESRLFFVDNIIAMGAQIILCDPHRAIVIGHSRLYGQKVASPDIRAGMAMIIAALCAEGTSYIHNIGQIDRGFENIDTRLRALGARIERVNAD